MQHKMPRGGQVVIDRPRGLSEAVFPVFLVVAQDCLAVEHTVGAPFAAEQVAEIVDVHTDLKGLFVP